MSISGGNSSKISYLNSYASCNPIVISLMYLIIDCSLSYDFPYSWSSSSCNVPKEQKRNFQNKTFYYQCYQQLKMLIYPCILASLRKCTGMFRLWYTQTLEQYLWLLYKLSNFHIDSPIPSKHSQLCCLLLDTHTW